MANCGILLNDGTSFLLLNSGDFFLLNDNSCDAEPGGSTPPPSPPPPAPPAAAPDRGFDETLEAFARERRHIREEREIADIIQWESRTILEALRPLLKKLH